MNKADFIAGLLKAKDCPFESKAAAEKGLNFILNGIKGALSKGKLPRTIQFVGFGTFKVTRRKARKAKNPRTGEIIKVKAKNAPGFKAGKSFKDAV